jgi:16S rRNA (cytosine967-C5)-methyltransferase
MPPPTALRVMMGAERAALAAQIAEQRPDAQRSWGMVAPRALLLRRAGNPRKLRGYAEGSFAVQEEGAQVVALALGAQPGERVADLCAGHGGKTALLAEQVGATGHVTAVDLDERKLERVAPELQRQGLSEVPFAHAAIDLAAGIGELAAASFERVLVDAPCTGLGTLHRRPELLLRLGPGDPARMAELQAAILANAAKLVRSGGALAYAVCSPTAEEGAQVADRFERAHPDFVRYRGPWPDGIGRLQCDSDGILRVGPWLGDPEWGSPDAYQVVRWRRVPKS